jgi:8-hydroxy-5-deazaflavin:NADPH oxidoreductase
MRKVAVLGSGNVGAALAAGFLKYGNQVMRASREPRKLQDWKVQAGPAASVGDFAEAAEWGDLIVLAVKGAAAESAVELAGVKRLAGKTVMDATNPIVDGDPRVNGVFLFFTGPNDSLMERLQRLAPEANFVKAFSCVGFGLMVNPTFVQGRPTMFICGNSESAKREVSEVAVQFGWDVEDMGLVESARAIEPLCQLWCIPAFRRNSFTHAFAMLKH